MHAFSRSAPAAVILAVLVVGTGTPAHAESADRSAGFRGLGPRIGISIDPDQVHAGAHLDLGDVASRVSLVPNLEVGFGDEFTVLTIMADFDYRFPSIGSAWRPYAGGGIGPVFISHDRGGDDTELGITAQGGFTRRNASGSTVFLELKLGLVDAPDAKFTIGWTFPS